MVVVMSATATAADIEVIVDKVAAAGGEAFVSRGVQRTIIGLVGDVERFYALNLRALPGVSDVVRISVPFKLVSGENHPKRSTVWVRGSGNGQVCLRSGEEETDRFIDTRRGEG